MSEQNISMATSFSIFGVLIAAVFFINAGANANKLYFLGVIACILLVVVLLFIRKKLLFSIYYKRFINNWGKKEERKRNMNYLKNFFNMIQKKEAFFLDDQTWTDLNMDEVFGTIDRTITSPGEETLYSILRNIKLSEEPLLLRDKVINLFQSNEKIREEVAIELISVGRRKENEVPNLLWKELNVSTKYRPIFITFTLALLASAIGAVLLRSVTAIFLLMMVMVINNILHLKFKKDIGLYVSSLSYLGAIIKAAQKISNIETEELKEYKEILKEESKKVESLIKGAADLNRSEGVDLLADYFYATLLVEERRFFSALNYIKKYNEELRQLYLCIGELDALMTVASYRDGLTIYSKPEFKQEGKLFQAEDLIHPLLEKAVSNSINLDEKGIILTGSNMSGKSTFLRTLGVNAVLAQSIYTCRARSYKASFFKVMSSISPEDNLSGGKSYYFREAEALHRIIKECGEEHPLLCIIDEIFRGTNPLERVNASAEILAYIEKHNTLTIVATHDLELTEMLKDRYLCYYFSEDINEEGLVFDYKLKQGVSNTRNAVRLLKYLGYPEEIIEKTNERISNF
ncbi:MAG: MutS family DNA mismatch repair protein [Bacillota bacterium]|nr:MutS family DNA mismatch repair protein [Bacillota bacterium]